MYVGAGCLPCRYRGKGCKLQGDKGIIVGGREQQFGGHTGSDDVASNGVKAWSWSGASADDVVGILRELRGRHGENWRVKLGTGFPNDAIIVMVNGLCLPFDAMMIY